MQKSRRFTWIFLFVSLALALSQPYFLALATRADFWGLSGRTLGLGSIAVLMLPMGYIYGRNSARKDELGKIARFFLLSSIISVFIGYIAGGVWVLLSALGLGLLAGFIPGWMIQTRAREKYGDSIEADQVMNLTRSEHLPPRTTPAREFYNAQDSTTRKVINRLFHLQVLIFVSAGGVVLWAALADIFYYLTRLMVVRPNDGTLYFLTTEPMMFCIQMLVLSIMASAVVGNRILPAIAGNRKDKWFEYEALLSKRNRKPMLPQSLTNRLWVVFSLLLGVSVLLFIDTYVKVTKEGIEINRYWGIGAKSYSWNDIQDVEIHQDKYICDNCGGEHQKVKARITFSDGSVWKPDTDSARAVTQTKIVDAIQYVAERTGLAQFDSTGPPETGMPPPQ